MWGIFDKMASSMIWSFLCFLQLVGFVLANDHVSVEGVIQIDNKLSTGHRDWLKLAQIYVDGGKVIGVPRSDGSFKINGLPRSNSYTVEISHPTFVFPQFRIDVNSKGQMRARKLNHLQPKAVDAVSYPLVFQAAGKAPYFQKREEWRITDMLMNPMVLMMVLPMLLLFILPKMMNLADEETKKEMESVSLFKPAQGMPDISETLTNMLGGGSTTTQKSKKKK